MKHCPTLIACVLLIISLQARAQSDAPDSNESAMEKERYQSLLDADWQEVFFDSFTGNWQDNWQLDGKRATITQGEQGLDLHAGPTAGDDACHAVLWTNQSFTGDVKIEYEFTRLDDATEFVNILYIQATGSGEDGFDEDIMKWADRREVPAMRLYFNHMNTQHISYAAYDHGNEDPANDYIRARRYMPETGKGLEGTDLPPDHYTHTGLFATGLPHQITVIKSGDRTYMHVENADGGYLCYWKTDALPPIDHGRIGLRQMYTRAARYKNFRVSVLEK